MLSSWTWLCSSGVRIGFDARLRTTIVLNMPTSNAPATAVPTAAARLLVVPRSEPTSPASSFGDAVTSTLNSSVTSAPWPMPNTISPSMTGTELQSLRTTNDSHSSPAVHRMKPNRPICRGAKRS